MDGPPIAGETHLHRYEIHKRVADRLRRTTGITEITAKPSPMRPVRLQVTIDQSLFFTESMSSDTATLKFEWRPRPDIDVFRIQYNEPGTPWSCGWHQDESHEELGPSHFQVDHGTWTTPYREPASFSDPNPMAIIEVCLGELRERVPRLPDTVRQPQK